MNGNKGATPDPQIHAFILTRLWESSITTDPGGGGGGVMDACLMFAYYVGS